LSTQLFLSPSFKKIERVNLAKDLSRVEGAIQSELVALDGILRGYAEWQDTYNYVRTRADDSYLATNYSDSLLDPIGVNMVVLYDSKGNILYAQGAEGLEEFLDETHALVAQGDFEPRQGLYYGKTHCVLAVSRAVTNDDASAPPMGRLCFGKYFDYNMVTLLTNQTKVSFTVSSIAQGDRVAGKQEPAILSKNFEFSASGVVLSKVIYDPKGQPVITLSVFENRVVMEEGLHAMEKMMALFFSLSAVLLAALVFLLRISMLNPLKELTARTHEISLSGNLNVRLPDANNDEMGMFTRSFNDLLERLSSMTDQLERRVNERTKQLNETVRQLKLTEYVFDFAREGIVITDTDGVIQRVNKYFTQITGYSEADALGKTPRILKSGRHDAAFYKQLWQTLLETGAWAGEIWNRAKDGHIYPEWLSIGTIRDERGEASHFVSIFHDMSENKKTEELIRHQAFHDPLTGLPNRLFLEIEFEKIIARAVRRNCGFSVLFLDLDYFKQINDSKGHDVGDAILREAAERIRLTCRNEETVVRQGGDEFVVVMEDLSSTEPVTLFAERVIESISQPFVVNGNSFQLGVSIGASFFPNNGKTGDILLRNADAAMYQAKSAGRNRVRVYQEEVNADTVSRLNLEYRLRDAIKAGAINVHFQPIFSIKGTEIEFLEALARWVEPDGSEIFPETFLALAAHGNFSLDLDALVLETALRESLQYGYPISVNCSISSVLTPKFKSIVAEQLKAFNLDPSKLTIEISESFAERREEDVVKYLNDINSLGVHLALDNFGSGYSSLAQLSRLPVSSVKIDRTFTRNVVLSRNDADIISSIVAIAKRLSLKTVATGVETEEQRKALASLGCDYAQGWLFGQPASIVEIMKYRRVEF
jgi:diguanylate cyclase (GGDEF)-like protein/PAS domain S-box-containing protein